MHRALVIVSVIVGTMFPGTVVAAASTPSNYLYLREAQLAQHRAMVQIERQNPGKHAHRGRCDRLARNRFSCTVITTSIDSDNIREECEWGVHVRKWTAGSRVGLSWYSTFRFCAEAP